MEAPITANIISRSRLVPVAVTDQKGMFRYFLHGREMKLHEFKKYCKRMPPIETVVLKQLEKSTHKQLNPTKK